MHNWGHSDRFGGANVTVQDMQGRGEERKKTPKDRSSLQDVHLEKESSYWLICTM